MSKANPVLVGIDVSAKTLEVCIKTSRATRSMELPNDAAGHERLVRTLQKFKSGSRVAVEATGVYHLEAAWALHQAAGVEVTVLNPRVFANFAKAMDQRGKSDRDDAHVLTEFVQRMAFEPWQPPSEHLMALRAITRRIAQLVQECTRERNRTHALKKTINLPKAVLDDVEHNIEQLQVRIKRLENVGLELMRADDELAQLYDLAVTAPGIGKRTALILLAELAVLPDDLTPKQWVAHAGLDPCHRQSGTSVITRPRISKRGNIHLRAALYMPAVAAINTSAAVQVYTARLAEKHKPTDVIRVAVMRKLLHAVHGMWRTKTEFDPARFTPMPTIDPGSVATAG